MNLLILGGTRFVGRHLVEAAQARGHSLTLFNRGKSNPDLFPDVEMLTGDRDGGLDVLEGRRWDAVIDTSGYLPRLVGASADLLADAVSRYLFISTISVYPDDNPPPIGEDAPLRELEDDTVEEITGETYGGLKVLCEQAVERALPDRTLLVRPGLIVGPHDPTDRFTYWVRRVARGGEVLAPGSPDAAIQFIDGRDLARWTIDMVEQEQTGMFNATGPAEPLTWGEFLNACISATASDATLTWVDDDFLTAQGDDVFRQLPMWFPAGASTLMQADISRAKSVGLEFRPIEDTILDTLTWAQTRPLSYEWRAGLDDEQESALLDAWHTADD